MRQEFKVVYSDGRKFDVVAKPKDVVAFERQYGKSMAAFGDQQNPPPLEWLYYLAWSPLHRSGLEPRGFDEFLDDVEEVEPVEDQTAPDPSRTEPSDGTSPPSP